MPNTGDSFDIVLNLAHLGWGIHRYTDSREPIFGEGYIPIPRIYAKRFNILNSNSSYANLRYKCISTDGFYNGILLAQGSARTGDIYAKQFAEEGNLKGLGTWYTRIQAYAGDHLRITWSSPTEITIDHYRQEKREQK